MSENNIAIPMLSEFVSKNDYYEHLEDISWDGDVMIEKGFYLEVYINPDGIYSDSSSGISYFRFMDKEMPLDTLINLPVFNEGSFSDETMTINVIPNSAPLYKEERDKSTNISLDETN